MPNKIVNCSIIIVLLLLLSACIPSTDTIDNTSPTAATVTPEVSTKNVACVFETISPADVIREIVNISGDAPKSENFSLDSETTIRVYWNQTSKENFLLSTINLDPKLSDSPERKIAFESYVGPSSGCNDATISAGQYQVNVKDADGPWAVLIQAISYKK
ncbi:MAG: hypothetical protein C0410_09665 [Anaerolinea sp.]|nr:hypothetical protein [Anaerolinea sp.]